MTAAQSDETGDRGRFAREASVVRDWVTADGTTSFPAAAGRYHLYVSYACPWASRTIIVRQLKGLEGVIGMTVVDPVRDELGWRFDPERPDPVGGFDYLSEAYLLSDPHFNARVTVPVLWDTYTRRIVNNESSEIVRMLESEFDAFAANPGVDLYPPDLREEIDALNERIYTDVNDGVYRAGFATSQEAYEEAVERVFAALAWLEERLATRRFLCGERITEADWRLFVTLVRFDAVYVGHFKCNLRRIADHANLDGYLRDLYQQPGIAATVDFDHIKRHYYITHHHINPTRIVPKGPELHLTAPHGRGHLTGAQ
ncbi:MAG: glutathione S-transferase family protein [Solirubrobacteraceae bacterium]|nr:glutathione S-transferase family protein [Solirubrobacteraceae bacterium]